MDLIDLKGSKTEKNLLAAFAGESQARNKYTFFSSQAKKDGYEQIAAIFQETADNEKEHAKIWYKMLNGDRIHETAENLKAAADGEHYEHTSMYPEFAAEAKKEGFTKIAALFEMVAGIEKEHEQRYITLLANLQNDSIFKKAVKVKWLCSNCGYEHDTENAPQVCPVCAHPQAYFMVKNYSYE